MGYIEEAGIKAICFDIDGTLYPKHEMQKRLVLSFFSAPLFTLKYNRMRQKMRAQDGYTMAPVMTLDQFRDKECRIIYPYPNEEKLLWYRTAYKTAIADRFRTLFSDIKPFPKAVEALKRAKEEGCKIGILSDFPIGSKLEALGISALPDYAQSAEDYGYLKPNPRPFIEMAKAMDVEAEEILYVGDSLEKDMEGAHGVGMHTCYLGVLSKKRDCVDISVKNYAGFIARLFD